MEDKNTSEQNSNFQSFSDSFKKKSPEEQANDMISLSRPQNAKDKNNKYKENHHKPKQSKSHNQNNQNKNLYNTEQEQKSFDKQRWQNKNPQSPHHNQTKNDDESKNGIREVRDVNEKDNLGLHKDLKRGVEANTRIQRQSLNPHNKLNLNTKASVRITPLGGLGEIGGNITVIETPDSAIVIDVGMSFPNEDMHGVDILVPDFSYLFAIKDKIAGVIITHAHEDHIGAVPYLFKLLQFPIYGTPLPLGMIGSKK